MHFIYFTITIDPVRLYDDLNPNGGSLYLLKAQCSVLAGLAAMMEIACGEQIINR